MLDRLALLDQINRELPANVDWKAGAQRFVARCFDKMGRDTVEKYSMNKPFGVPRHRLSKRLQSTHQDSGCRIPVAAEDRSNSVLHRKLWDWMRSELAKIDFANRTVLDIGCWDGYWSFYAEQRGASRVLATDDKTQNWSGNSGLELARELMGSSVETRTDVSIYEAAKLGDRFDIVLCLGVYYHLVDPFYAFSQIRHCSHARSVVIFEGDFGPDSWLPQQAAFLDLGDPARCFVPSVPFLRQMLEANYFHILTESIYHGLPDQLVNRIFVTCEPFEGENALHCTRPPFGLHCYDPRFSAN